MEYYAHNCTPGRKITTDKLNMLDVVIFLPIEYLMIYIPVDRPPFHGSLPHGLGLLPHGVPPTKKSSTIKS